MVLFEAEIVWYKPNQEKLGEEIERVEKKLIEAKDEKQALQKAEVIYSMQTNFTVWSPSQAADMRKSNWLAGGFFDKDKMPDSIGIRKPNIIK